MISFIADVHVGNHKRCGGPTVGHVNKRCQEVITSLAKAREVCDGPLVILGDLFDKHNPHPAMLRTTGEALKTFSPQTQNIIIAGNHDIASTESYDSAISPLSWLDYTLTIYLPLHIEVGGVSLIIVPFRPGVMWENVSEALKSMNPKPGAVLAGHFGIHDDATAPWLKNSESAVSFETVNSWCTKWDLAGVFVGDWHDRRVWSADNGAPIVQVGALVPTGWDNEGHDYGHVTTFTDSGIKNTVIDGPRFFNVSSEKEASNILKNLSGNSQARLKLKSKLSEGFMAELNSNPKVIDVIQDLDISSNSSSAKSAVAAVKNGAPIEELISVYVDNMDIKASVKDSVKSSALTYFSKA